MINTTTTTAVVKKELFSTHNMTFDLASASFLSDTHSEVEGMCMLAELLQQPLLQTTVGFPLLGHRGEGLGGRARSDRQKEGGRVRKHDITPTINKLITFS